MELPRVQAVLDHWFGPPVPGGGLPAGRMGLWFGRDEAVDAEIRDRFGADIEAALAGELDAWAQRPKGRLALILLLDQFTRNAFRGTPKAFAGDARALELSLAGMAERVDEALGPFERMFFYLPLEHAEDGPAQEQSVAAFEQLLADAPEAAQDALRGALDYARRHREVVERFGRFPHRNEVLGRTTTEEERAYLRQPGAGF